MAQKQPIQVTFKDAKMEFTITCSTVEEMKSAYAIIKHAAEPRRIIVPGAKQPEPESPGDYFARHCSV